MIFFNYLNHVIFMYKYMTPGRYCTFLCQEHITFNVRVILASLCYTDGCNVVAILYLSFPDIWI